MEIKKDGDIKFSTGKVVNANNGIVGIGVDGNIYSGYDDNIHDKDWAHEDMKLTATEQLELIECMLGKWGELKKSLLAP